MNILVTGNLGYVGAAVQSHLSDPRGPAARVTGFDTGFFAHELTGTVRQPETRIACQHFGDVREIPEALLRGIDAVVHLAAISNDPMGREFEAVTAQVNRDASVRLARMCVAGGVRSFVFASSCSVYGAASGARREGDAVNPLTAYARSKVETESAIESLDLGGMAFTSLRFATACGMSDRLRLDLVLNDFVAGATFDGEVKVLSDGSPWRPLIDVEDMARAIAWAVARPESAGGRRLRVNVGRNDANYQVGDIARAVCARFPQARLSINRDAAPDRRSYRVDFSRLAELAPAAVPRLSLDESIIGLARGLGTGNAAAGRPSGLVRLDTLRRHVAEGRLDDQLRWR